MKPPASFLQTMEDYVREAPRVSTVRKDQVQKCSLFCGFVSMEEQSCYRTLDITDHWEPDKLSKISLCVIQKKLYQIGLLTWGQDIIKDYPSVFLCLQWGKVF